MKFIVSVDAEGPACVVGAPGAGLNQSKNVEFALRQATREADAAARALFEAGAAQVIVVDAHSAGVNLHYDELDSRCDIALGAGKPYRFPGMGEDFAGLLLIGYHAMDNTADAVLAHTFSSAEYQWMKVNGREVGELAIDAAIAGLRGVPIIFASGDNKCVAEAKTFFPWVQTVTTKQALGWSSALSKHPKRACDEIHQEVGRAVKRLKEMKPFTFESPVTMEMRFKRLERAEGTSRGRSGWERVDAYTVRKTGQTIEDFF